MSMPRFALPLLLATLAGCTGTGGTAPEAPVTGVTDDLLAGHHWQLADATGADGARIAALFPDPGRRLGLDFTDGRLRISGGCNGGIASYRLVAPGQLEVGEPASTLKACAEPLMLADRAIHSLLSGGPLRLWLQADAPPTLILESADGTRSSWTGEATAETRYGTPGERVFLEVAPRKVACDHPLIAGHRCLQVREVRYDEAGIRQPPDGDWQPLYGQIEGFDFVAGERKVLRVKRFTLDSAPADRPAVALVLDMVVETERVAPAR